MFVIDIPKSINYISKSASDMILSESKKSTSNDAGSGEEGLWGVGEGGERGNVIRERILGYGGGRYLRFFNIEPGGAS